MNRVLIDSNIMLDIFLNDPQWADWSETVLNQYGDSHILCINPIIYSEVSIGFEGIEALEAALTAADFQMLDLPKEALFLAGKAFVQYRRQKGTKFSTLPDFFIGAHAAVLQIALITRDVSRYKTYFPTVNLISPPI
jgi:predicted nucleic acid-binding protein